MNLALTHNLMRHNTCLPQAICEDEIAFAIPLQSLAVEELRMQFLSPSQSWD